MGWYPDKINKNLDLVILGMHAKRDNPELKKAIDMNINIMSYPQYIYETSKDKTRVVIAGSHGKTTISSMIIHTAIFNNLKINFLLGEKVKSINENINISSKSDFIVVEGDEYPCSCLDLSPKFHVYKPNIAIISGISWDHINVFESFDKYLEQFKIFIQKITPGGVLIYNEEDEILKDIVSTNANHIKKIPYGTHPHLIKDKKVFLDTINGNMPLSFFGKHNLSNLMGAKLICRQIGIQDEDFYDAILEYQLPKRRLEMIQNTQDRVIFTDFAHSPSKVKATTETIREQFKERFLLSCLELHTFSSLNLEFIHQYKGCLDKSDIAIIYISKKNLKSKQSSPIKDDLVKTAFKNDKIKIFRDPKELELFLIYIDRELKNKVFLFMSSGNFDEIDLNSIF